MDMADIAKRAAAAHEALDALAQAVRNLPEPKFNFARSVDLLAQLSGWAERNRPDSGFSEAGVLSSALEAGLEKGCKGRKAEPQKPDGMKPNVRKKGGKEPSPTLTTLNASGDGSITLTSIAMVMGRAGGKSRSKDKVAAARANIGEINRKKRLLASRHRKGRD